MRRAGLLVHAYLIYGFPGQSRGDIVDSAEVCRQLFASGLVDSAFWHRFVLTRHSRMYAEWRARAPPSYPSIGLGLREQRPRLRGRGLRRIRRPPSSALEAWMSGEGLEDLPGQAAASQLEAAGLGRPSGRKGGSRQRLPGSAPGRGPPRPRRGRARCRAKGRAGRAHWIAGLPSARPDDAGLYRLTWICRGEARELRLHREAAIAAAELLSALARDSEGAPFAKLEGELVHRLGLDDEAMDELRSSGLVVV